MNNQSKNKSILDNILPKIKNGQIKMRPRSYFMGRTILLVLGIIIVFLTLLYSASLIFFILRQNGLWFMPWFGRPGWHILIGSLPWILILIVIIFIILFEILIKHYSWTYRRPLVYSVILVVFVVILGSFLIIKTPLHNHLWQKARQGQAPFFKPMYSGLDQLRLTKVHPGKISALNDQGFILENHRGETATVIITHNTRLPLGAAFKIGDFVVVWGQKNGQTIQAEGVRQVDEPMTWPPPGRHPIPREHRGF